MSPQRRNPERIKISEAFLEELNACVKLKEGLNKISKIHPLRKWMSSDLRLNMDAMGADDEDEELVKKLEEKFNERKKQLIEELKWYVGKEKAEYTMSDGEKLEGLKTLIIEDGLNSYSKKREIIGGRTTKYDDYVNHVDNFFIDKDVNPLGSFDAVVPEDRRWREAEGENPFIHKLVGKKEKLFEENFFTIKQEGERRRVYKKYDRGGKIKYGPKKTKEGRVVPGHLENVPIICLHYPSSRLKKDLWKICVREDEERKREVFSRLIANIEKELETLSDPKLPSSYDRKEEGFLKLIENINKFREGLKKERGRIAKNYPEIDKQIEEAREDIDLIYERISRESEYF